MKETKPDVIKKDSAPQIKARTFSEKFFRGIVTLTGKEIFVPIVAGLISYGGTELIDNYIHTNHGVPAIEKDMAKINEQIKVIRDRQKNMGGPIPEWWDRVVVKGNITSSVNALELKLRTLETKKAATSSAAEAIKPYWDFLIFGLLFTLTVGYIREFVGTLLDKLDTNWREKKIVNETNKALLEIYSKLAALEKSISELTEKITEKTDLEALKGQFEKTLEEVKAEVEKLPEDKKE